MGEIDEIYRGMVHWGVPVVLIGTLHYLQQISRRLNEISLSLAVVVTRLEAHQKKLEEHDTRILRLETK